MIYRRNYLLFLASILNALGCSLYAQPDLRHLVSQETFDEDYDDDENDFNQGPGTYKYNFQTGEVEFTPAGTPCSISYNADLPRVVCKQPDCNFEATYTDYCKQKFSQNNLMLAILNNDLDGVQKFSQNVQDINEELKIEFYFLKTNEEQPEFELEEITTYLASAIKNSVFVKGEQEIRTNYEIIKALLEKGANPNAIIGFAVFEFEHEGCFWKDFPWNGPITFEALRSPNSAILDLLLAHGACANGKAPTYGDLLLEARSLKNAEKIALVKRYLMEQEKRGICAQTIPEDDFDDFSILEYMERMKIDQETEGFEGIDDPEVMRYELRDLTGDYNSSNETEH